jgi:deazaflavin-dependent oxidoreductase (nitroreductase family)
VERRPVPGAHHHRAPLRAQAPDNLDLRHGWRLFFVVGSNGGKKDNPQWCYNLGANPHVHVQVAAEKFDAIARIATGDERKQVWRMMAEIWPDYVRNSR